MTLGLRITLAVSGTLLAVLLGLALGLYRVIEGDLRADFERDLITLTRVQAGLAVEGERVMLRPVPGGALQQGGDPLQSYLLRPDGRVVQALAAAPPPRLTPAELRRAAAGDPLLLYEGERRSPWEIFEPRLAVHTRVAAHPILDIQGPGVQRPGLGVAYLVVVRARDEATVAALARLRRELLLWLGVGLALSVLCGVLLARHLTRPVRRMAAAAARVRRGDLSVRVSAGRRRDELGQLARDFDRMLDRLQALAHAQRRFTADAAHDLRTPVAVLRGEAELALRRERSPEEYRNVLRRIQGDLTGLSRLSDDLLTLARLEGGETPSPTVLPLREALALPLSTAGALATARGRTLHAELPEVPVHADPALLARAVGNLLNNALTHGGNTRIWAETRGQNLRLHVEDDGPGVPPELQGGALFARFRRGQGSAGSGLGLAIAREVARLHGGRLTHRGPPDGPSTFSLHLPGAGGPPADR